MPDLGFNCRTERDKWRAGGIVHGEGRNHQNSQRLIEISLIASFETNDTSMRQSSLSRTHRVGPRACSNSIRYIFFFLQLTVSNPFHASVAYRLGPGGLCAIPPLHFNTGMKWASFPLTRNMQVPCIRARLRPLLIFLSKKT